MRKVVAIATAVLLVCWLPADIASIRFGLETEPRLAVGISLKILMHLLAVAGLFLDKTFGYAFLLGASLQGLLVASGSLRSLPISDWAQHLTQIVGPALDVVLRLLSLGFLATRPGRIVGKGAPV